MPVLEGPIRKMKTDLLDTVSYRLPVGDQMLELNPLIGKEIAFLSQVSFRASRAADKPRRASIKDTVIPASSALPPAISASSSLNCAIFMRELVESQNGVNKIALHRISFILQTRRA